MKVLNQSLGILKFATFLSLVLASFLVFLASKSHAQNLQCHQLFQSKNLELNAVLNTKNVLSELQLVDEKSELDINRLNASWEISRLGVGDLLSSLHNMENVLYYSLTAILAHENILIDGPGGGAKTLALRKVYQAQLNAVNKKDPQELLNKYQQSYELQKALLEIIQKDSSLTDPQQKIFTQQFHATLSESKVLGGPDPFKFIGDGQYEIDYKKALIHEANMYAILDELEKAPVSLQMTLLSILNERQALVGNKIIQTMLESVAATTNATLGELIAQALPHEVGGRRAMIDRFALKVHTVNISANPLDAFLLIEKAEKAKNENKFTVIDLRGLHPLINKVVIPKEVLHAMTDITLHLDRRYTEHLVKAQEEVQGTQLAPAFYPPFSGSTRNQSKVIKIWQSAFLARQLIMGIPFEHLRVKMNAQDLVDLAPALLQGGPELIAPQMGVRIPFVQAVEKDPFTILGSNSKKTRLQNYNLSVGYYDPYTRVFQYTSALTEEVRQIYLDPQNKLVINNDAIKKEIILDPQDIALVTANARTQKYQNIEETLKRVHVELAQNKKFQKQNPFPAYQLAGRLDDILQNAPLRESPKKQLEEIAHYHQEFIDVVNLQIQLLSQKSSSEVDLKPLQSKLTKFKDQGQDLNQKIKEAIQIKDTDKIQELAAESILKSFKEFSYLFKGAESTVRSIYLAILNNKNVMIFGPPGSAKTMISRLIFTKELEHLSELQVAQINSLLAEQLTHSKVSSESLWIKQFHPMSNEGDIVGRIDLAALKRGEGYSYNRSGSLSSKDVLFSLLDEFEKAPPAVRTSLLSLLNERQLLDGDTVVNSSLMAVVLATNSTPSEFMMSQGDFSTAFPIYDRIHEKTYSLNKLSPHDLAEFHQKIYLKTPFKIKSPLLIHPLIEFKKRFKIKNYEKILLTQIHQEFMSEAVKKSDAERTMHLVDSQNWPDFYLNTRGESSRSLISAQVEELPGVILLDRILKGQSLEQIKDQGFQFDLIDLESVAQLYLTHNSFIEIRHDYDVQGLLTFKVIEKDLSAVIDRLDAREQKTFENLKWEADLMAQVLNRSVQNFMKTQARVLAQHPELYPSAFSSATERTRWLKAAGLSDDQIVNQNHK